MNNFFAKYETDHKKENDGVSLDIEGSKFYCRRAGGGNRAYRAAMGMGGLVPEMRERLNSTDPAVQLAAEDEVTMRAFADAVVTGWEGVAGRDGKPLEFSRENFMDLMSSCPDLWLMLRMEARDADNFRIEQVQEIGKALGNGSDGTEDTEQS